MSVGRGQTAIGARSPPPCSAPRAKASVAACQMGAGGNHDGPAHAPGGDDFGQPGCGPDRRQRPGRAGRPLRFRFVGQKQSSACESATHAWIVRGGSLPRATADARNHAVAGASRVLKLVLVRSRRDKRSLGRARIEAQPEALLDIRDATAPGRESVPARAVVGHSSGQPAERGRVGPTIGSAGSGTSKERPQLWRWPGERDEGDRPRQVRLP
jgi:hypothetical protein